MYKYWKSPLPHEQLYADVEGSGWLEKTDPEIASCPQEIQSLLAVKFLKVPVGQTLQSPRSKKYPGGQRQSLSVLEGLSKPVEWNPGRHVQLEPPS